MHFVSMFIDEARITIGISHDNVVRLDDFGQVDGIYFMAIEYVDGTDLAALLRTLSLTSAALPPIIAAAICRDVCAGLAHAHTLHDATGAPLGIVHRDVSPQNVLLSSAGAVKVTDFGIAAARNKLSLTTPGMVLGKAAYMAPEQARGEGVDFRTDLWALGVMLWECLVGERLFAASNPIDTLERVLNDQVPLPSSRRQGIPVALDSLVMTLLARDPRERPQRSSDVTKALHTVVQQLAKTSNWASDGHFDAADMARFLATVEWRDDTAPMRPSTPKEPAAASGDVTRRRSTALIEDPVLRPLVARLREDQEPWLMQDIGDRAFSIGMEDVALSAWRTAAACFAARGLLVQALAAHASVRAVIGDDAAAAEIELIGDLNPGSDDELFALLNRWDKHGLAFGVTPAQLPLAPRVPLLSDLGPKELSRLAAVVSVKRVQAGDVILREGDRGDVLYALARGRLVVSCSPGDSLTNVVETGAAGAFSDGPDWGSDATAQDSNLRLDDIMLRQQRNKRVYLAGLADGDFFGEFSFLAERPRSATVEAVTDAILVEIERQDVEHIAAVDPAFTAPLLGFYKERVVELMMAKSPVFSLLPPEDRRSLLDKALVVDVEDGELIVKEGTRNDALFFIRRGEVEIFRNDALGDVIFINKLGQGQFFGEIAALRGSPRAVSVRAIGPASLFQIEGAALQAVVAKDHRVKLLFDAMIAKRTAEAKARVQEHHRVFFGT